MSRHLLVTGASGFLGRAVVAAALEERRITRVTASDLVSSGQSHAKLTGLHCDLNDPALHEAAATADIIIHLAATLGGAAETDPEGARRVNLDASLRLMAACTRDTRFVFASSLAVLGDTMRARAPVMVYGAHKAMAEIAVETATRRGEIDGISLRPGGIVARDGDGAGLKSAFLSRLFWAVARGEDITLPVSPDAQTWLASVRNVAANFLHAAQARDLGPKRSLTLPMICAPFSELVAALHGAFPQSPSKISYAPQDDIMRLFGRAQPLAFDDGLAAGFRADPDLATLINNALPDGDL